MIKEHLAFAIERSQLAYNLYVEDKMYYQAMRIYNANTRIYELLERYLYEVDTKGKEEVCDYLFHLEDWFAQFDKQVETLQPELEDEFIFERLTKSKAYPKNFYNNLITNR